jgi:Ca2+-binding RTX toxin-like protein
MTSKAIGKRTVLLLAAIVTTLMACSGVALAVTVVNCGSLLQDPLTPLCEGTGQDDDIMGRNAGDNILAIGGNDTIRANGGNDSVDASAGNDEVYGGDGRDTLAGGSDDDSLFGGNGADTLADDSDSYADKDKLRGGEGNDSLGAYDNDYNDTLVCGPGKDDTAYFDANKFLMKHDTVSDTCEHTRRNIDVFPDPVPGR